MNDRIEKARMQYIYDDWEEYPQEAIEISQREEIMQDSKENFRKAIEDNLPLPPSVSELIEKLKKIKEDNWDWDTFDEYLWWVRNWLQIAIDSLQSLLPPNHQQ